MYDATTLSTTTFSIATLSIMGLFTTFSINGTQHYIVKSSTIMLSIEMKGITRCKLTIISESAVCKKFLGEIWSNVAGL